ncbi:MAG TPA: hypothetical protein VJY34_17720 [Roseiarcus sp.]|nr:hypothetical protein [Roseiarcus sp.]
MSEAIFQEQIGNPITYIPVPDADNATATYAGAQVKGAAHPLAAQALARLHPLSRGAEHLRKVRLQALPGQLNDVVKDARCLAPGARVHPLRNITLALRRRMRYPQD